MRVTLLTLFCKFPTRYEISKLATTLLPSVCRMSGFVIFVNVHKTKIEEFLCDLIVLQAEFTRFQENSVKVALGWLTFSSLSCRLLRGGDV